MSAPLVKLSELPCSMLSCTSDVNAWETASRLKPNDNKTSLMLVTSKRTKHLHNLHTSITIGIAQIPFKHSVKNLGITLDRHLTMNAHVANIARTCYFELRRLASIITIHLKLLHWLPVKVRSTYKIACLCYYCHRCTAPSYVTDMLLKKQLHTRNTCSSSYTTLLLNSPLQSMATLGDRSFSFAYFSVWNSILNDIRCAPPL